MEELKINRVEKIPSAAYQLSTAPRNPAPEPASRNEAPEQPTRAEIKSTVAAFNEFAATHQLNVNFSVDDNTGKTVIKMIDASTKELIKQIPPKEILNMAASLEKLAGAFFHALA